MLLATAALIPTAAAVDLKVLRAGAFKPVLTALAPQFEQRSGHRLVIENDTAGALAKLIAPKAVLVPGGLVAQRLVTGEADLAIHQISEILAVQGAVFVGPLPAEIQNHTVHAGALPPNPRDAAAQALPTLLGSEQARAVLADKGMQAP